MSAVVSYVQLREGYYYVGSSRVSLRSVVEGWRRGEMPEYIQVGFPSLSLAQVFGSLAFYLEHQEEVEETFRAEDAIAAKYQAISEAKGAEFYAEFRRRVAEHRVKRGESEPESTVE